MTLQNELAIRLLEIPDVETRELGRSKMLVSGTKEIARFRDNGLIDIHLSHSLIRALGLASDETESGWVRMNVKAQQDFPAVIALIQRAVKSSKYSA